MQRSEQYFFKPNKFFLTALRRNQPYKHLHLGLPASKTETINFLFKLLVWGNLLQQHQQINIALSQLKRILGLGISQAQSIGASIQLCNKQDSDTSAHLTEETRSFKKLSSLSKVQSKSAADLGPSDLRSSGFQPQSLCHSYYI